MPQAELMRNDRPVDRAGVVRILAIALGVVMPVVTAVAYPTYFTMMSKPWYETTRVIELPYLIFEIGFILWAGRRGFDLVAAIKALPRDIRIALGIWLAVMSFGLVFVSSDVFYALTHSLMWIFHIAFALAVFSVLKGSNVPSDDRFFHWHGVGLAVLAIYTAWWFGTVPPAETLPFGMVELRGAVPGWISVRHFGSWTGAITAAFAIRILFGASGRDMAWARAFYFLAAGLTVWSGTRAAILAVVVVTLVFLLFLRRWPDLGRIAWAAGLTLAATALAYLLLPDDPAFHLIETRDFESGWGFAITRTLIWTRSVEIWLSSPWVGLGTGSIFWEYSPSYRPTQPHNVVLQFLISWGVIGAAAALWVAFRGIKFVHRAGKAVPVAFPALAMLYALLFQSLLEGMLHYPRFIVSIVVLSVVVLVIARGQDSSAGAN